MTNAAVKNLDLDVERSGIAALERIRGERRGGGLGGVTFGGNHRPVISATKTGCQTGCHEYRPRYSGNQRLTNSGRRLLLIPRSQTLSGNAFGSPRDSISRTFRPRGDRRWNRLSNCVPRQSLGTRKSLIYFFTKSRTSSRCPADPSFVAVCAMNLAYSSMKVLPGGRKSNAPGLSRKNSR
jgi:hypothetical protein